MGSDILARAGAACVAAGAAGLAVYAWRTWGTRARWTTDPGWHRFAIGGLVSAIAWLEVGMAVAASRVIAFGAAANGGAAALSVGVPIRFDPLVAAGAVLVAISLGATAVLLGAAVRVGVRRPSSPRPESAR